MIGAGERVKIGVVGAGIWGANHALALKDYARADLSVICDLDETRAQAAGAKFGCAWTTSLDALAESDVQAVTIATPDHLHREPTIRMLRAGKHVMVEKPLATSIADGKAMVEAAAKAGVKLMVDFHARWHPLFMGAKAYVERGDLGNPVTFNYPQMPSLRTLRLSRCR
jgi:predicted dehydrogenase